MSYAPFDGVLLDDMRPPVPWALAMALHFQVAERPGSQINQDAIEAKAVACSELIAHGLLPATLRNLSKYGLDLGNPDAPHSLASLTNHLEHYLEAVSSAGYIEPNAALWEATDAELNGERGLWVERVPLDGPLDVTLKDIQPARLRALACLPQLGGAIFRLATRRGDGSSGLFGSSQPLADWFLDGIENHGQSFIADIQLAEPDGWGDAPWSGAIDQLFEGQLNLDGYKTCFQRALVEDPLCLTRYAVEQIVAWINQGISPQDITLIHPFPENIREFMEVLLNAEGVPLNSPNSLRSLIQSEVWSPVWSFLQGLSHLDPLDAATGLCASRSMEVRAWADLLATSDQTGYEPFDACVERLPEKFRAKIKILWQTLLNIKSSKHSPSEWWEALNNLVSSSLRFPLTPDGFYAPMGLLKECWGESSLLKSNPKKHWDFDRMVGSLRVFLESARSAGVPNTPDGVKLLSPSSLLDDWEGASATLVLDLSEGAWPAIPKANPHLDFNCRAAINKALAQASKNHTGPFSPALQRFWLPMAEYADQIPRAFQRDAYAFNKVLAMTRQHLVALSPAQDESGRNLAQGAFWTAIEGAAEWTLDANTCYSRLRWNWDGAHRAELADDRSKSARAIGPEAIFNSSAPDEDRILGLRVALQNQKPYISPTVLESLARCPFRAVADRVWHLDTSDAAGLLQRAVGTVTHNLLQSLYQPVLLTPDWPAAFVANNNLKDTSADTLEYLVNDYWQKNQNDWLSDKLRLNTYQLSQARGQIDALVPNIAACLKNDIEATCPTVAELALLFPDKVEISARANSDHCYKNGWQRTITGLEQKLGSIELVLNSEDARLHVAGIADRVELWENATECLSFYRVIDYKTTTKQRLNAYATGDAPFASHLQTPLYMWIVMETFSSQATSVLIPLREPTPRPFANHLKPLHEINSMGGKWQHKLARTLSHLDPRIEQGDYPPTPGDHCHNCPYAALCARPVDIAAFDDSEDGDGDGDVT